MQKIANGHLDFEYEFSVRLISLKVLIDNG